MKTYQYAIQRPEGGIPGYIQIDVIVDGHGTRSSTLEELRAEGVPLDAPPYDLPTGSYTQAQVRAAWFAAAA